MSSPTYNWDRWQLGSPSEYLEWIYRMVTREGPPKSILEIGLGPGASTVATLLATEQDLIAVNTVDINPPPTTIQRVEELVHPAKRWNLIYGDSSEFMDSTPMKFDYIYIDGDHSEEGVFRDAVAAYRILSPGGVIVFDDAGAIEFTIGVNAGIKRAFENIKDLVEEFPDLDVINPNGPRVFRKSNA